MSPARRVAQTRAERGWSQAELARRSGVSRTEVSAIETGRLVPSVAAALRIARALAEPVERLFAPREDSARESWAWEPFASLDGRVWRATVSGRARLYPVEPTAAGVLPHDGWFDGTRLSGRSGAEAPPERTLVLAGCDPLVGLLARELAARHGVRVLPLLRSSGQALQLLRRGLAHAAGVHFTDPRGRSTNDRVVRRALGAGFRLVHQMRWDAGVAVQPQRRERTLRALLRANLRWVNREEGSAARLAFDALLPSGQRPRGYEHVVRDHRAVAATVSSGWAEAGICVRPAAAEARLAFVPLHREAYELCVPESLLEDPRIRALLATLQSSSTRRLLGDVPGCHARETGNVRSLG